MHILFGDYYRKHFTRAILKVFLIVQLLLTFGCSGSSDTDTTNDPDPTNNNTAEPGLTVSNASVTEGNSGTINLIFNLSLSATAENIVSVDYTTTDGTATSADNDYIAINSNLSIPVGETTATISIEVNGDTTTENSESFTLTLSNPVNATLDNTTAIGQIISDDLPPINDTGIDTCANTFNSYGTCPQSDYPGQDAEQGRDVTDNNPDDGHAGFSFTQLDASGNPLSVKSDDYSVIPWSCVKDNVTGLIWEVKERLSGYRRMSYSYTWYNSSGINDGGHAGTENNGSCGDSINCDTEKFVTQVNVTGLCGYSDWRLPTREELLSISNLSSSSINTDERAIDINYFPNSQPARYWTSSPTAFASTFAWQIDNTNGTDNIDFDKSYSFYVRLVRN